MSDQTACMPFGTPADTDHTTSVVSLANCADYSSHMFSSYTASTYLALILYVLDDISTTLTLVNQAATSGIRHGGSTITVWITLLHS